jgi:Rrf2 family protein
MHIPAKVDYGMRALLELARSGEPETGEALARAQELPTKFLVAILTDLRRAGFITSQRGMAGGYRLSRPASEITVADVIRALDGPLAEVRGLRPEMTPYEGAAEHLQEVWVAARASLRSVLEQVSVADIVEDHLPPHVAALVADPDSWSPRVRTI